MKLFFRYIPWLLLLLGVDAFAALLLWLANVQAFYAMMTIILLYTLLFFSALCYALIHLERKKEQAFLDFLDSPDEYHEELLLKTVSLPQRDHILLLGRALREKQSSYTALLEQWSDYEEYVESWAHETKIPLSLLTLILDNRREELPATIVFKLDYIRNRMQESIDHMLFYARLKSARKDYLFEFIPIKTCIEELLEDYSPLLEEKDFSIQFDLPDETVYSDRRGLRFLLEQLISNSIKYCGQNPELCFQSSQKNGRYVLNVKDNGIGVRSCDLPYIFEKGFTGDSGEDRKRATGMGLYLVNEIANDLNLSLRVNSEWKKGFEIEISFPIVDKKQNIAAASCLPDIFLS